MSRNRLLVSDILIPCSLILGTQLLALHIIQCDYGMVQINNFFYINASSNVIVPYQSKEYESNRKNNTLSQSSLPQFYLISKIFLFTRFSHFRGLYLSYSSIFFFQSLTNIFITTLNKRIRNYIDQ
jgi:hypothetical protein